MSLISEVSSWKLEAKLEDSSKYFLDTFESEKIKSGEKAFLIGRKGTGKTAIAKSIANLKSSKIFVSELSFKNFPFNELYKYKDNSFNRPNQYITI